jgi:O-antigen/teichoic acid export membrane protein
MIKRLLQEYRVNEKFKQVLTLLSVNVIAIPLSIISSIIITRFLGASAYGDFKYLASLFNLSIILLNLGIFQAANRALVLTNDRTKARELYGAALTLLGLLFLVISIALFFYAMFDRNIQEKGLQSTLMWTIPVAWIFLLSRYFEVLLQADNKISLLAKSRLYPKIAFFTTILILYLIFFNYSGNRLHIIWMLFLGTEMVGYIYILLRIYPSFKNLKNRINEIWHYNKAYGFNVYLGSIFSTGFSALTGILISYFGIDNSGVGFYALALTIAGPLEFIPNVIATTHYKDFSSRRGIPRKLLLITVGFTLLALGGIWALVSPFINFFYGIEFRPVIALTFITSLGVVFTGMADFFNRFLGAHGQGKALRNSAFIVGLGIMVLNITLIPSFGETGAAYVKVCSGLLYLILMLIYYRKLSLSLKNSNV